MRSDSQAGADSKNIAAVRLRLSGRVQGVGYRPFVLRLARQRDIAGSVQNLLGEVEVIAEGPSRDIETFAADLVARAPPLAQPCMGRREAILPRGLRGFVILESASATAANVFVPPDAFTCADCLRELNDPRDRRYGYPFINCTQCGPRYTLIHALPYDRKNTTMAKFALCEAVRHRIFNARRSPLPRRAAGVFCMRPAPDPRAEAASGLYGDRERHCCRWCDCCGRVPWLPSRALAAITSCAMRASQRRSRRCARASGGLTSLWPFCFRSVVPTGWTRCASM